MPPKIILKTTPAAPTPNITIDEDDDGNALKGASGQGYLWEEAYKRSWDVLQEDEEGSLRSVIASLAAAQKRRRTQNRDTRPLHRGIIRHVYMILDVSRSMSDLTTADHLKAGGKMESAANMAESFVGEFFDVNPLGSLGIIVTKNSIAEKITDLSGNPNEHVSAIKKRENREPSGEPSLQNSLELARESLLHTPENGCREILIIYGSLTTCDPGNIFETIKLLKQDGIRVSIISLAAEMQICKTICTETKGTFSVVLNDVHFKEIMSQHVPPPPLEVSKQHSTNTMMEMGFPLSSTFDSPTLCANHQKPTHIGYVCPRCGISVCELPTDCPVCSLTLVSSTLLARSYHHLFPVPAFNEVLASSMPLSKNCQGCQIPFPPIKSRHHPMTPGATPRSNTTLGLPPQTPKSAKGALEFPTGRFECVKCKGHFCIECDVYAHDILHQCPGCMASSEYANLAGAEIFAVASAQTTAIL